MRELVLVSLTPELRTLALDVIINMLRRYMTECPYKNTHNE